MIYTVYFEIFDKKMKVDVEAMNEKHARSVVRNRIAIHKVILKHAQGNSKARAMNDMPDIFKDIFGGFNK